MGSPEAGRNLPRLRRRQIEDDPENEARAFEQDISRSANGFSQMRRDALSANRQATGPKAEQIRLEQQQREKSKAERAQEHLLAWNAQMTTVGGVRMTNAEAQKARQGVIDNADHYAKWAVQKGLIRPEEAKDFKGTAERITELEKKRGEQSITPEEEREAQRLGQSRVGKAFETSVGQHHQYKGNLPNLQANTTAAPDSFKSAPQLSSAFAAAQAPAPDKELRPSVPIAPQVSTTGLTL